MFTAIRQLICLLLFLQVYTIDRYTRKLTVAGYTTINLFVETGTDKQPAIDSGGIQVQYTASLTLPYDNVSFESSIKVVLVTECGFMLGCVF